MIKFACPNCGKSMKAPDDAAGKRGNCTGCNTKVDIPIRSEAAIATIVPKPPAVIRVPCIYCGEDIAETAIKCKHCNEYQDGRPSQQQLAMATPAPAPVPAPSVNVNVSQTMTAGNQRHWNAFLAVILSLIFPGLGQLYKGQFLRAVLWVLLIIAGYVAFIVPGIILQFCCLIDAAVSEPRR